MTRLTSNFLANLLLVGGVEKRMTWERSSGDFVGSIVIPCSDLVETTLIVYQILSLFLGTCTCTSSSSSSSTVAYYSSTL
jgi:hypothetical protein